MSFYIKKTNCSLITIVILDYCETNRHKKKITVSLNVINKNLWYVFNKIHTTGLLVYNIHDGDFL